MQWHPDIHAGAASGEIVVAEPDSPAMVFNDAGNNGEAEANSILSRRHIGLEQALAVLQPNLVGGDGHELAGLRDQLAAMTERVATLREELLHLEDAQEVVRVADSGALPWVPANVPMLLHMRAVMDINAHQDGLAAAKITDGVYAEPVCYECDGARGADRRQRQGVDRVRGQAGRRRQSARPGRRGRARVSGALSAPMAARASRGRTSISRPQTVTLPLVLLTRPAMMLMKVDLPAPLGPSRPKIEPRGTARSRPFSAVLAGAAPLAA